MEIGIKTDKSHIFTCPARQRNKNLKIKFKQNVLSCYTSLCNSEKIQYFFIPGNASEKQSLSLLSAVMLLISCNVVMMENIIILLHIRHQGNKVHFNPIFREMALQPGDKADMSRGGCRLK